MDTIFALASGRGKAGISVIRLSGPQTFATVALLCGSLPEVRRASFRKIRFQGEILDEAIVVIFAAGSSFTGEESAEFHIHGSMATNRAIIRALLNCAGLRLAEPGEFTRRALENGRLDLTEVEGLADLIEAETDAQRRQALRVMSGALAEQVGTWRKGLIRAAALIEATIDFADEDVPIDVVPEVSGLVEGLLVSLQQEIKGAVAAERVRDGFEVAIIGAPNAGKSTLLNALAGREAAITSEIPGTTRDVIEVRMEISGLAVTLLDTAGLRDSDDQIERLGIARAKERAEAADLRVFLLSHNAEDIPLKRQPGDVVVMGKADLGAGENGAVSGKTGQGLDRLLESIGSELSQRVAGSGLLIRERHLVAIRGAVAGLMRVRQSLHSEVALELIAADLHHVTLAIESVVGRIDVESLLDEIFSSFCIGK